MSNMTLAFEFNTATINDLFNELNNIDLIKAQISETTTAHILYLWNEDDNRFYPVTGELIDDSKNRFVKVWYDGPVLKEVLCSDGEWRELDVGALIAKHVLDLDARGVCTIVNHETMDLTSYGYSFSDGMLLGYEVANNEVVEISEGGINLASVLNAKKDDYGI